MNITRDIQDPDNCKLGYLSTFHWYIGISTYDISHIETLLYDSIQCSI